MMLKKIETPKIKSTMWTSVEELIIWMKEQIKWRNAKAIVIYYNRTHKRFVYHLKDYKEDGELQHIEYWEEELE